MSTCKDCLHYEACKGTYYSAKGDEDILYEFDGEMYAHSGCEHFKPKADYTTVVRCKDCAVPHNKWTGCPKLNGLIPPPNHFCSYGERKEK